MKKVMFNDRFLLTQAVLDGRKTQTRRFINPQPILTEHSGFEWKGSLYGLGFNQKETYKNFLGSIKTPYKVGEVVAIAQRYSEVGSASFDMWERETDWFKKGFSNKMFVKPELMPHQIRITNVRVQRLQEITYEDCLKEGVYIFDEDYMNPLAYIYTYHGANQLFYHPRDAYAHMIDALSGKGTWGSNPYVFVYDFELVK